MPNEEAREEAKKEPEWYVVHTYSGYEKKVASNLATTVENRGFKELIPDIRVPIEMVTEITDGKPKTVERKIFPGYVFVKMVMNDDTWYIVRNIRGCTGFVGPSSSKPIPLSDAEVTAMGIEDESAKTPRIEVAYKVGDRVRIKDDSFDDSEGVVDSIDVQNNTVRVIVQMFGQDTPVDLELNKVEVLE